MPELEVSLMTRVEDATRHALEEMFFMAVFGRQESAEEAEHGAVTAQLTFTGDASGVLRIGLPAGSAAEAAANFLGLDSGDLTADQVRVVVGELANIVCGSALSQWRHDGLFSLNQPETTVGDAEPLPGADDCVLQLEQGTMRVSLVLNDAWTEGYSA